MLYLEYCNISINNSNFKNFPKMNFYNAIVLKILWKMEICSSEANVTFFTILLAHLSRRLMGELIVYQSLQRPSVRCPSVRLSTFSKIFSSETTGPIKLKFHMETP